MTVRCWLSYCGGSYMVFILTTYHIAFVCIVHWVRTAVSGCWLASRWVWLGWYVSNPENAPLYCLLYVWRRRWHCNIGDWRNRIEMSHEGINDCDTQTHGWRGVEDHSKLQLQAFHWPIFSIIMLIVGMCRSCGKYYDIVQCGSVAWPWSISSSNSVRMLLQ